MGALQVAESQGSSRTLLKSIESVRVPPRLGAAFRVMSFFPVRERPAKNCSQCCSANNCVKLKHVRKQTYPPKNHLSPCGTYDRILPAQKASPGHRWKAAVAHVQTCKPEERAGRTFSSEGGFLYFRFFMYQKYLYINVNIC